MHTLTVVGMPRQVLGINEQIMIRVQLPELAVDDVEMFVREIISDYVDVLFIFQRLENLKELEGTYDSFTYTVPLNNDNKLVHWKVSFI